MGQGGAARKLIGDGIPFDLSSDNDPKFTAGGFYVSEKQDTTGNPYFLTDKASGALTGLEGRASHADGSFEAYDSIFKKCAESGPVSTLYQTADGTKYTAAGGAMWIPEGAADGMISMREGKIAFGIHPVDGKWIKA